ncbi:MAG: hypothetical protein WC381_06740 [Kiritimatiellia bacterium]|jgi:hypothetical protein
MACNLHPAAAGGNPVVFILAGPEANMVAFNYEALAVSAAGCRNNKGIHYGF